MIKQYLQGDWHPRYQWKKWIVVLSSLLLVALLSKWIFGSSKADEASPLKKVEVELVQQQEIVQTVHLLGTIHPKHLTTLIAKGNGMLDALIPTGQKVTKGSLLAKIDNADVEKNLQLSAAAEALAKSQYDRISPLLKTGYISAKDVEEKKQAWIDAQKDLSRTKIELDNLRFYAPFDGIIGAYKKREGAQIGAGDAVVTLYDPSSLVVDFDIPCTNLNLIHEGQAVHILNKKYNLSHLQRMVDEDTHMCPADVDIDCETCLIGTSIEVDLVVAEKEQVLVVPYQAIFLKNGKPCVYVVEEGKIKLISVQTGLRQQDKIEISAGLKAGQQLVTKGQERLYPELAVEIVQQLTNNSKLS